MKMMSRETIATINRALLFQSGNPYESPRIRPWQHIQMQYARVGLPAPFRIPDLNSLEQADCWMCLDSRYNARLREISRPAAC